MIKLGEVQREIENVNRIIEETERRHETNMCRKVGVAY
jgi:hypothetical protein